MAAENMLIILLTSLLGDGMDKNRMEVCLNNAISAIRGYINKADVNVEQLYPYQAAQLACFYYRSFDDAHLDSKSQGGRSITLSKDIPEYIKKTLPRYAKPF